MVGPWRVLHNARRAPPGPSCDVAGGSERGGVPEKTTPARTDRPPRQASTAWTYKSIEGSADDTVRVVVHATDDGFVEAGRRLSGAVTVEHDYRGTTRAVRNAHVRVASFTARIGGHCECEQVEAGFMAPFAGQVSLPDATGGAAFDIDDVAAGRLHFADAIPSLVDNAICNE